MERSVRILSAFAAGTLAFVVGTSTAHAINPDQLKCQKTIAKEAGKFVKGQLKLRQKCLDANLATPSSCTTPADPAALQKLVDKLRSGLEKGCTFSTNTPGNLASIGFPGPCPDPDSLNGFTLTDLQDCIENSHRDALTGVCDGGTNKGQACTVLSDCPDGGPGTFCLGMLGVEYDADITSLTDAALKCQKEIAKDSAKYVATLLKNVQKCRNGLLDCKTEKDSEGQDITTCKVSGVLPKDCAASEPKTKEAVDKARTKAHDAIVKKCSVADVTTIQACEPNQTDPAAAADCELDFHQDRTDNPDATALSDLIDFEYAQPGFCGDARKNGPNEECDGSDDSACPGLCGEPLGLFPCLCQNLKRIRVVEHANADLDNGWTGQSHDSGIVEGGGYVTDLWDCDPPDTLCSVGPTCSCPGCVPGQVHASCAPDKNPLPALDTGNEICASIPASGGGGGTCRRTAGGTTGPHCEIDIDKRCLSDAGCPGEGDRCVTVAHGAPLPIASGGVSVCVVNIFSEDVRGTKDLASGAGAVFLRQNSATYLGPDQQEPCPVCGGFCSGDAGPFSPGVRNLCKTNADCTAPAVCVTDPVCSWGPNQDQPCRPDTPSGGTTEFFGNPSVDCAMAGSLLGIIDVFFNPVTTDTTERKALIDCGTLGFTNKTCAGGPNQHAVCTVDSECPGGECNEQCFCPGGPQKPNACNAACVGGTDDAQPCTDNSECAAPGFCHPADCRLNPLDLDSCQEGQCTVGPGNQTCSVHTFVSCTSNAACRPSGTCPFCAESETCNTAPRECFVGPTIRRCGAPGVTDHIAGAIFCDAKTSSAAVNNTAGLPGPAAITNHDTDTIVP